MNALRLCKVILPLLLLTGCWSKVEINEQMFVFAIFIDKGEQPDSVEVTLGSPLPNRLSPGKQTGGSNDGTPYTMINKTGNSIPETINAIQRDATRQLDFSHTRVVVISREFAESGIRDVLDWILREPSLNFSSFLLASEGKAKQIAELAPVFEQMPSSVLMRFEVLNNALATTARDCLFGMLGGQGFALTYVNSELKPLLSEKEKLERWTGIEGAALFHKDKMKGVMSEKETKALAWALNHIRKPLYTVTWDGGKSKASVLFINTKAKKELHMTDSGPAFTVKLKGTGDLILLKDSGNRTPVEVNKIITHELEQMIRTDMENALRVTKELGTDVLQFGNMIEAKYPKIWSEFVVNWDDRYKDDIQIDVKTKIMVRHSGASTS
ncbi:Ger(x)C family spore germination protein [Paenibacillus faecalis]|uniref:Ger(x)C family spore germination protein n=1 Tax=Paenibacillus faecalis TaxID=2079532 RepID=UPI000D0ED598|nr:Ger(x)C family spore germination protein [Paenibacillus faecalis]